MGRIANQCEGSLSMPTVTDITVQPQTYYDRFNYRRGSLGRALCRLCGREIGINPQGRVSAHSRPEE